MCRRCGAPNCYLLSLNSRDDSVSFEAVFNKAWFTLEKCTNCGQLWAATAYEPYGTVRWAAQWLHQVEDWLKLHDTHPDVLKSWIDAIVVRHWQNLPEKSINYIEWWRNRTYRSHNPIDSEWGRDRKKVDNAVLEFDRTMLEIIK